MPVLAPLRAPKEEFSDFRPFCPLKAIKTTLKAVLEVLLEVALEVLELLLELLSFLLGG